MKIISVVLALFIFTGCGIQQRVVRGTMNPIIAGGMDAMMAETNLDLAEAALASNLKLIEGMLRSDPGNTELLLYAGQGFTAYSLGFVEDVSEPEARELYRRARGYANRWLIEEAGTDLLAIEDLVKFDEAVSALDEEHLPGAFWLANAWGSEILLSLDDITAISSLPRVERLMQFVLDTDPSYWFGGAHLFFGGYYGARPAMLGGNLETARQHLEAQIELTGGDMLLGQLFMVRYVHLRTLDETAARAELEGILEYDIESGPENTRLINRIAQKKALDLLDNIENYL